jgi:HPt (histidine-containing phosphotransfer) domain-containing protein
MNEYISNQILLPPAIDAQTFQELRAIAGTDVDEVMSQLIECYLEDVPQRLQAINQAVNQGDAHALKMSAHALRSSSITIGATFLSQLCAALEAMGRAGTTAEAAKLLIQLDAEYERVEDALQLAHPKK